MNNNSKKKTYGMLKRLFFNYVKQHQSKLFISIFCMVIVAASTAINAWMMQPVLDEIFINKNQKLIILIPLAIVFVAIVKGISSYYQSILMSYIGYKLVADIQSEMFYSAVKKKALLPEISISSGPAFTKSIISSVPTLYGSASQVSAIFVF